MPITCPHCSREFSGDKLNARHLAKCNPSTRKPVLPCLCGHVSTSATQMKRHRRDCSVWKTRDKKAVQQARTKAAFTKRYGEGVTNARHLPEAEERRKQTVREKYGADNVFSRESSVFEQVQASLEGKRPVLKGQDNPFARSEVQAKIRQHWQDKHGVDNPQQVSGIRQKTRQTNLERYGVEEVLSSPEVREAIRKTCMRVYAGPAPSCSPEVLQKQQATNQERYGVPWTSMNPEVRAKQLATMEKNYGGHFFASDEGKGVIRAAMVEKYGVEFPGQMEGHWDKAVAAFQKRYGVDHPLQDPEILKKARQTCIERYGTPFPGLMAKGPNKLEQKVWDMAPGLVFTGDGGYWRRLPKLGAYKNPDFVVPGPDPDHPFRGATKVVEVFGNYWHGRMKTGVANFKHEQELVEAFAEVGLECLVLWERDIKREATNIQARLLRFQEAQ